MEELTTIQKREKLNRIYPGDEPGPGGARHRYFIIPDAERDIPERDRGLMFIIDFQKGPRNAQDSETGVCDQDLLEIVRDRLRAFQAGPMPCNETARALMYIEQALIQLNMRIEDRIERGVLGTMEK